MQTSRILKLVALSTLLASAAIPGAVAASEDTASTSTPANVRAQTLAGAYLAAKSAQLGGDLRAATEYFEQALAIDPTAELLQQDAMFAFLADGRFEEGVNLAAKLRDEPESGKVARITLGIHALTRGKFDDAIAELDIPNPSDLDALLLGHLTSWAEVGAGRVDEALERVEAMDQAAWYPIFNHYQAGLLADVAGRTEAARGFLETLLEDRDSAQTSPDAYLAAAEALGRLEARAGNKDAALAAVDKGLALAATYDPLLHLRERIEAGETIEPAVSDVREGAAETLRILGQAINRGDGQQVALLYFQLALALDPDNPAILTALAGIAERSERLDLAIDYYEQVPEDSAYRRTAELQMGLDLWYAERKEEAKEHLRRAVADYPDDIQAHMALADVLAADKDYAAAAEILDEAIALAEPGETSNWNLYYQRGIAHERLKQWEKAEPDFKTALELMPDQPQVLNYLGYSWVDMNRNLDEGLEMIQTAVELRPNDGYIIDSLGWAYYRLGRFEEAVEELERAVLINPSDPTINDHLGDAYWRVGREREARFQWDRALVGTPEPEPSVVAEIREKLENGLEPFEERAAVEPEEAGGPAAADPSPAPLDESVPGEASDDATPAPAGGPGSTTN